MGVVRHCDADGQATTQDCLREEQCDEVGGAHCAVAVCPGIRNADVCIDARTVGQCQGGSVVGHKDCGADVCAVSGGQAHCAPASACGCSTGGSAASSVWTLGLALAVLAARRRRIG
jgi:MYXO-CTERM domain-containing protein